MNRRRSLLAAALAAAAAPRIASAQSAPPKVVGYLSGGQGPEWLSKVLATRGYVEGRNLRIETRIPPDWEGETLARAARELVALRPDVLYAIMANRVGALAAATRTIPIVTGGVPDPVGAGFAQSLRRPGANITGLSFGLAETAQIVVGILKTLRPALGRLSGIFPASLSAVHMGGWWAAECRRAGIEWRPVGVATAEEGERLVAGMAGEAAIVAPFRDPAVGARMVAAATRHRVASVGQTRDGALMNYGMEFEDSDARIAALLDRVLRGGDPAAIPFELPDRPTFEWNRATARALAIELPRDLSLRVTRYVE
jgi:putative ABC transport system substrate-binding protein